MRSTRLLAAGAAACLIAGGVLVMSRGAGAAPDAAVPVRVGVVDVFAIVSKGPAHDQVEAKRMQSFRELDAFKDSKSQELNDLRGKIEITPTSSRGALEEEYARKNVSLDFELKWRASKAKQAYADSLELLFAEVRAKVAEVARERGITLVLSKADDKLSLDEPGAYRSWLAAHSLLYSDPSLDITADVQAKVDASHRSPTPAAPPGPSSAPPVPTSPSAVPPIPPGPNPLPAMKN